MQHQAELAKVAAEQKARQKESEAHLAMAGRQKARVRVYL